MFLCEQSEDSDTSDSEELTVDFIHVDSRDEEFLGFLMIRGVSVLKA